MTKRILHQGEVELLFVKSKAYLHPTPSKKDNIAGFLSLSRPPSSTNLDIILAFTPESQLSKEEIKIYNEVDVEEVDLNLNAFKKHGKARGDRIVSKPSSSILSSYAFTTTLSYIYSIQFRNPSHGYYYGSIVINTQDGEKLPIVFFHDDESPSTIKNQKLHNKQFDPFADGELYWGALDFLNVLTSLVNIEKSTIEPSVYLVNPQSEDLRNFAPFKNKQVKEEPPASSFQLPDVNKMFNTAKWKVLETVATFTAKTKNQVIDLIEENAPPQVKQLMVQPQVAKLGDEFDSARMYLAKWAQQVKEDAESSKYVTDDEIYERISRELNSNKLLTQEEISRTSRMKPVSIQEWEGFFDHTGRLIVTVKEVKDRIFHGGLEDEVRKEAWLFLLKVYPWDSSNEEREVLKKSFASRYDELKLKWIDDAERRNTDYFKDQKFKIEKDVNRTDRDLEIFKNVEGDVEEPDDEYDVANITNPHLCKLREILLTYNEYNTELGYVQGMNDVLSPLYVVLQDEVLSFWAFVHLMDRLDGNFDPELSGIKLQLTKLMKVTQLTLPNLYKHLIKCQSEGLYFFFRHILLQFKRELRWEQVLQLWEVIWTDFYTNDFQLFFALAVLSDNERIIIENVSQPEEVLKYFNDLSGHLDVNKLLVRAEILYKLYDRMTYIVD